MSADYNILFSPDSKNNFYVGIIPTSNYFEDFLSCEIPPIVKNDREYPKDRFCAFIHNNNGKKACPDVEIRNKFFRMLSEYKQVDSGGAVMNNTDELCMAPYHLGLKIFFHEFHRCIVSQRMMVSFAVIPVKPIG